MTDKIKVHIILDHSDAAFVEAIKSVENVEVVQWDFSFDTAFQWLMFNDEEIDVFFASEYAQVSTLDENGRQVPRDLALLRRVKELHLMRPRAKFVLLCDEDRELPENRRFLSNLVAIGIYDFLPKTELTEEEIRSAILGPKNDITHVQQYLPENIPASSKPFVKKSIEKIEKEKEHRAIDIFAIISRFRKEEKPGEEEGPEKRRPKVKHIIEKVRPSAVSFYPVGTSEASALFLATEFAVKLADRGAKTALIELHGTGIPRLGFHTGVISTIKTTETALQRVEDEEDILPVFNVPKEIELPHYDRAIQEKLKNLPDSLYVLPGKSSAVPSVHPFKSIKPSTLDAAPQEIASQLIFGHNFDCVIFVLTGSLTHKTVFHGIRTSNYVYFVTDQHSAHISWLKQTLYALERAKISLKNARIVLFPYYELPNIRLSDIETALGTEVDYILPDATRELLNMSWGAGKIESEDFSREIARMILEATGYKLSDLEEKKRKFEIKLFAGRAKKERKGKQEQAEKQDETQRKEAASE